MLRIGLGAKRDDRDGDLDRVEQRLVGQARTLCVTGDRAREQQFALAVVVAQVGRAQELLARLGQPSKADEEVATHAW